MKTQAEISKLQEALTLASGAMKGKTTLSILSNVLMESKGDKLSIYATDMDLFATIACECKTETAGTVAIPFAKIKSMVDSLGSGHLSIEGNCDKAILRAGEMKLNVPLASVDSFPEMLTATDTICELPSEVLCRGVASVRQTVTKDIKLGTVFNGMLLQVEEGRLTLASVDGVKGHRMSLFKVPANTDKAAHIIIPLAGVEALYTALKNCPDGVDVPVRLTGGIVELEINGNRFASRLLDGKFPDMEKVMDRFDYKSCPPLNLDYPQAIETAKRVYNLTSEGEFDSLDLELEPGQLTFLANNTLTGVDATEKIEVEYDGPARTYRTKGDYFLALLQQGQGATIYPTNDLALMARRGNEWAHIAMTIKVD